MCLRIFLLLLCLASLPSAALAQTVPAWEIGLRGGLEGDLPFEQAGIEEQYVNAELYLLKFLDWERPLGESTRLRTRLDTGLGYLEAKGDVGGWLAFGGDLVLSAFADRFEVEGGFRPAVLFRDHYGKDDFGGPIHFATHLGLAVNFGPVAVNYRFQHMSNAGIYDHNPGIDLHLIGLGYRFD